jgi:hypothetical protein
MPRREPKATYTSEALMDDEDDLTDDREGQEEPEEDFAELLEQSLARPAHLEPGRRITAKVLKAGAE